MTDVAVASIVAGTPRTGIWCDRCLTSAGWEVGVHLLTEDGVSVNSLGVARGCSRCDEKKP